MKDLGVSHNHPMAVESKGEDSKSYPGMTIDHKVMPHLKKHKVGDTGHMKIKYKVTGQNSYRNGQSESRLDITHAEHTKKGDE